MFYLLDQPTEDEFASLAGRYKEMAPSSVHAAVTLLKVGSDVLTGFERLLQRYGLSQGRFLVLVVMNRRPEETTTPSALAEKIGVTRATMTGLIDGLAADGLISRDTDPDDRRRQNVKLTPKGIGLLEDLMPDYWSRIFNLMRGLTAEEEKMLVRLLNAVSGRVDELTRDGEMTVRGEVIIRPFEVGVDRDVMGLILPIQRDEFGIAITESDQPDLVDIPGFYQTGCGNFWIALDGPRIVGTIALRDIGGGMAALRKMFVHADYRGNGKGVAKRLLQALLAWSEQQGLQHIFLGTTSKFLAAHRFYEKNGFVEIPQSALPETFPLMNVDTKFYRFDLSRCANGTG